MTSTNRGAEAVLHRRTHSIVRGVSVAIPSAAIMVAVFIMIPLLVRRRWR